MTDFGEIQILTSEHMPKDRVLMFDPNNLVVIAPCRHCGQQIQLFPVLALHLVTELEELMEWWHIAMWDDGGLAAGERTTQVCCVTEAIEGNHHVVTFEFAEPPQ